ncbi:MAG: hypothetical protein LBK67_00165 [Coriobacteriales bacterium]|jgi:hypothetical protein|nr:hypothetical protein [Coriobacteriales bacterium]
MSNLSDKVHEWQTDTAFELYRVLVPEGEDEPLVDADEICFLGALPLLPKDLEYLAGIGTPAQEPEVYVVAVKDGHLIPPNIWFAPPMQGRLEAAGIRLQGRMKELMDMHREAGQNYPSLVRTALVMASSQAITIQDFDRLPDPPDALMTAADWAFDKWVAKIQHYGSAFAELNA